MPANPRIQLNLFASTRQPINPDFKSLVRINNGNQTVPTVVIETPSGRIVRTNPSAREVKALLEAA